MLTIFFLILKIFYLTQINWWWIILFIIIDSSFYGSLNKKIENIENRIEELENNIHEKL